MGTFGTRDNNSRLFGREAQLFVASDYGTLSVSFP